MGRLLRGNLHKLMYVVFTFKNGNTWQPSIYLIKYKSTYYRVLPVVFFHAFRKVRIATSKLGDTTWSKTQLAVNRAEPARTRNRGRRSELRERANPN
jgi:hypothetical protein